MEEQCVIARNINGIPLNDYEYVLGSDNELKVFINKDCAMNFLKQNGFTDDEIYYLRFFSYDKLMDNEYEEIE